MRAAEVTVYILDDDASVRQALARLVRSARIGTEEFETVPELISRSGHARPDCVIADIRMPEVSGLKLPGLLAHHGLRVPVIFVTAHDTERNREAARRAGAAAFFHKPIDGQALLDAIAWAIETARDPPTDTDPSH